MVEMLDDPLLSWELNFKVVGGLPRSLTKIVGCSEGSAEAKMVEVPASNTCHLGWGAFAFMTTGPGKWSMSTPSKSRKISTAQRPFLQFELMRNIHFQLGTISSGRYTLEESGLTNLPSVLP